VKLTQETENLFRLTRLGMVNCFLVKQDDGFTLVDTGLSGSAQAIVEVARGLGALLRRIEWALPRLLVTAHSKALTETLTPLESALKKVGEG
jgi:hypothetical protein